jgi:ornithine carbamoyltransferase
LLTVRERFGRLAGLRVAYLGDGNNVAHSLMEAGALAGMHVVVATPARHAPLACIVDAASAVAEANGGSVVVTRDPFEAVADAHAVYTDVWLSMGDSESERAARAAALAPYRVDWRIMAHARPDAVFMHCLPAHRGDEVTGEVIDGLQSVVFAQAANRLCTEQAVLASLLEQRLVGRNNEGLVLA